MCSLKTFHSKTGLCKKMEKSEMIGAEVGGRANRVTRLGEFSPAEKLFSFGQFFKYKSSPYLSYA
jgi:hypothetical protein